MRHQESRIRFPRQRQIGLPWKFIELVGYAGATVRIAPGDQKADPTAKAPPCRSTLFLALCAHERLVSGPTDQRKEGRREGKTAQFDAAPKTPKPNAPRKGPPVTGLAEGRADSGETSPLGIGAPTAPGFELVGSRSATNLRLQLHPVGGIVLLGVLLLPLAGTRWRRLRHDGERRSRRDRCRVRRYPRCSDGR